MMISFEEAQDIVFSSIRIVNVESVNLSACQGRILAESVYADADMPPFTRSAMDGYAIRREDASNPLEMVEEIPAGRFPQKKISENECAKIMTGAPVPEGSNWVVRVEDTDIDGNGKVIIKDPGKVSNIRYRGEDIKKNDIVIREGTCLRSQHIGILATAGMINPRVFCQPEVGVIATGSELVPAENDPGISQIRNSNGPQLIAHLNNLGLKACDYGIAPDSREQISSLILKAISENDVVLISGGVSAGDYDFVPELIKNAGFNIRFHKMKVRPGKPLLYAENGEKYIFGIPGNPVSTFIQFEMTIKPFLYKLMGYNMEKVNQPMIMGVDHRHTLSDLRYFIPVRFTDDGVIPVEYHGSGHLTSYAEAEGILIIPPGKEFISKGEKVQVRPI